MNKNVIKKLRTTDDLKNYFSLCHAYSEEHLVPYEKSFMLEDENLGTLEFMIASAIRGYLSNAYFKYTKNNFLFGLACISFGSDRVKILTDTIYMDFKYLSDNLFLCQTKDGHFDILYNGKVISHDVEDYDILSLGNICKFLQLDYSGHRSLICIEPNDVKNGIFFPTSLKSFSDYYENIISRYGYSGVLDNINVSDIFRIYYEVQNCIFQNGNFIAVEVDKYGN